MNIKDNVKTRAQITQLQFKQVRQETYPSKAQTQKEIDNLRASLNSKDSFTRGN